MLAIIDHLNSHVVEYAVIGAFAGAVHGSVRASQDADALIKLSVRDMKTLAAQLTQAGYEVELRTGDSDDPIPALMQISDQHGNRVDLLGGLRGLDSDAWSRTISIDFLGQTLRIISCEDFIAMKLFAGGPVDIDDANTAFAVNHPLIDKTLLAKLAQQFGNETAQRCHQLLNSNLPS